MLPDFDTCYRAVAGRDARFDGRFFTGVRTTGVYCRPVCPAQRPRRENVRFYASAAAAVAAGFRACRRCRPDTAPGSRQWDARGDLVARALRLVAAGAVDEEGVGGVAAQLHVSERHLHRVLVESVGAGPLALARTRRAQTARLLIDETDLPFADVAFAAGYGSVRQFNDTIRAELGTTPSRLRAVGGARRRPESTAGALTLRLRLRTPFDSAGLLEHLTRRAVPCLEEVRDGTWTRPVRGPRGVTLLSVTPAADHVVVRMRPEHLDDVPHLVAAVRRSWDLDADPAVIDSALADDPALAPLVADRPGIRVVSQVDGFEALVRAVLGQRVSVAAARTTTAALVAARGTPSADDPSRFAFPTADDLAGASTLAVPGRPARLSATLRELAVRVAGGRLDVRPTADRDEFRRLVQEVPGVGPWTAEYAALRALADPDAFPATDLVLAREVAARGADPACWRPWRAYGATHLWAAAASTSGRVPGRPARARREAAA